MPVEPKLSKENVRVTDNTGSIDAMRYLVVFVIFQFSPAVPAALLLSRLFPVLFLSASDSPRSKEQVRTNRTTYYVRSTNKSIGLHSTILGSPIL